MAKREAPKWLEDCLGGMRPPPEPIALVIAMLADAGYDAIDEPNSWVPYNRVDLELSRLRFGPSIRPDRVTLGYALRLLSPESERCRRYYTLAGLDPKDQAEFVRWDIVPGSLMRGRTCLSGPGVILSSGYPGKPSSDLKGRL